MPSCTSCKYSSCIFWLYRYLNAMLSHKSFTKSHFLIWTASSEFGTYRLCEQRRFRRACASAQSRQNLRCSLIQAVNQEAPSNRKPDPWPLWMAGHAQLKFVMTECSKTQIRLTGLIFYKLHILTTRNTCLFFAIPCAIRHYDARCIIRNTIKTYFYFFLLAYFWEQIIVWIINECVFKQLHHAKQEHRTID